MLLSGVALYLLARGTGGSTDIETHSIDSTGSEPRGHDEKPNPTFTREPFRYAAEPNMWDAHKDVILDPETMTGGHREAADAYFSQDGIRNAVLPTITDAQRVLNQRSCKRTIFTGDGTSIATACEQVNF